jgi:CBS domain-containing protein
MSAVEIAVSERAIGLRTLDAGMRSMRNGKGAQLMGKSVKDVMTSALATATPSQSLAEAARMMKQADVGSVPVVDGPRLFGMLTDRDIVVRAVAEGEDPQTMQVGEIASPDLVTVRPDDDLDDALRLMAQHQVRRLPVVEDGHLVGVLAQADVAHEAKEKQVGHVVEEISRPAS